MNKADASTVDLIMAEGHFTIDLQNSHILTPCVDHCEPERMTLDEALPSPDEVDTLSHLDFLIQGLWPAVDPDLLRIRLLKSTSEEESEPGSAHDTGFEIEPERFCQACLGVYERASDGSVTYEDIVIGPRIRYRDEDAKKPEFEMESEAIDEMVASLASYVSSLTPVSKKRVTDSSCVGSTVVEKKQKLGTKEMPISVD